MKEDWLRTYKKGIESGQEKPPDETWENISNQLDIEDSWQAISNQLDVDKVWHQVTKELDSVPAKELPTKPEKGIQPYKTALVILTLAVMINAGIHFAHKGIQLRNNKVESLEKASVEHNLPGELSKSERNENKKQKPAIQKIDKTKNDKTRDIHEANKEKTQNKKTKANLVKKQTKKMASAKGGKVQSDKESVNQIHLLHPEGKGQFRADNLDEKIQTLNQKQIKSVPINNRGKNNPVLPPVKMTKDNPVPANKEAYTILPITPKTNFRDPNSLNPNRGPFAVASPPTMNTENRTRIILLGFILAGENNWLLNRETLSGLDPSSLSNTLARFSAHGEFSAFIQVYKNWALLPSVTFRNSTGQSYMNYFEGKYLEKNIRLSYGGVALLVDREWYTAYFKESGLRFHTLAGLYFTGLWSAEQSIGKDREDVSSQYRNIDYGLVFGHEVELEVVKHFTFRPGLRVKWGIPNIYSGNQIIPARFNNTHTATIELTISLYYQLNR